MAKIQPSANSRKLTAAGFSCCADSLAPSHPQLATIMRDKSKLDQLETILQVHTSDKMIKQLERITAAKLLPRDAFDDMASLIGPTRYEIAAADHLDMNPPGTAEWVFEMFPEAKAHFCRLLIDAAEAEETFRELTVHYNFTGIDAGDMSDLLGFINDFCKVLRPLAAIQEKRARAIAQANKLAQTRKLEPTTSPQRA